MSPLSIKASDLVLTFSVTSLSFRGNHSKQQTATLNKNRHVGHFKISARLNDFPPQTWSTSGRPRQTQHSLDVLQQEDPFLPNIFQPEDLRMLNTS